MSESVQLSAEHQAAASKLVAEVGRRVRGNDATAQSQAKYIARHRAKSLGVGREVLDSFVDAVCQAIDQGFEQRRAAVPNPVLSSGAAKSNGKPGVS